ncbi:MAG: formylglycine-generating enzyme family protein [Burkholderiales bacterium]
MSGNVWEWVQDCYEPGYDKGQPSDGDAHRANDASCGRRVIRGGSWGDNPQYLRSANRFWGTPDDRDDNLGFRLARTVS